MKAIEASGMAKKMQMVRLSINSSSNDSESNLLFRFPLVHLILLTPLHHHLLLSLSTNVSTQIIDSAQTSPSPNPHLYGKNKIQVLHGKVEDEEIQRRGLENGRVDTIISEPIGVMLFHERMVSLFKSNSILFRDETVIPHITRQYA